MREKLIASGALCAGALSCWEMKNLLEIWYMAGRNCCKHRVRAYDWYFSLTLTLWSISVKLV